MSETEQQRMWRIAGRFSAIGIEIAVSVTLGILLGRYADSKFGTEPYLFWFGLVVGFGAAARTVVRLLKETKLSNL